MVRFFCRLEVPLARSSADVTPEDAHLTRPHGARDRIILADLGLRFTLAAHRVFTRFWQFILIINQRTPQGARIHGN